MIPELKSIQDEVNGLDVPQTVKDSLKAKLYKCLEAQTKHCSEALNSVHNENELTDSDVVWIELEDSKEAVQKACFSSES
ncbi:hypothetical protein [Vibrio owensii]|uniref:hypothetical protein n=1 Tax=Vibrio harveyi group TaxID=717610 RepID=UPI003CC636D6